MMDLRDTCQPDGAADRAARAARTLAAIAHDAARKYVKRDVVAPQPHRRYPNVMPGPYHPFGRDFDGSLPLALDDAERERQNRLRRWQALPYPNRKGG
jgi:hypothetical protein